jgi:hypothetical protein
MQDIGPRFNLLRLTSWIIHVVKYKKKRIIHVVKYKKNPIFTVLIRMKRRKMKVIRQHLEAKE